MTCPVCNGTGFLEVVVSAPAGSTVAGVSRERRPCIMGCQPAHTPGAANNAPLAGREVRIGCRIGRVKWKPNKAKRHEPDGDYDGPDIEVIDKRKLFGIED